MSLKNHIPVITVHILFWLLSSYFFVTFFSVETQEVSINTDGETTTETYYDNLFQQGLMIGIFARLIFFYAHLRYVIPFLTSRKIGNYTLGLLIIIGVAYLIENFIQYQLYHTWPIPGFTRVFIFIYTFYGLTSLGYGIYQAYKESEKTKLELNQKVIAHELEALKSQFDPHFVFNTLNSLLFIAEKEGNTTISTAIEEMSSLMRSVIYDFSEKTIPLSREIDLINKYINLQTLKLDQNDDVRIDLTVDPRFNEINPDIAPLILLPFVENAFKHGIDIYGTSWINIRIIYHEHELEFKVENSNHTPVQESKGIGLDNMKKRLQWLYPNNHYLKVDHGNPHIVILRINQHFIPTQAS